jgi:hypothetical protein
MGKTLCAIRHHVTQRDVTLLVLMANDIFLCEIFDSDR